MTQGIKEQIGLFPAIKPKAHFVQIGREMLCADLVPASDDSALEQRECGLYGIRVNVPFDVNAVFVLDSPMSRSMNSSFHHGLWVGLQFIGDHHVNVCAHVLFNKPCECSRFRIFGMKEAEIAATLPNADYDFFVGCVRSTSTLLNSADIGLVHFDSTLQNGTHFFHCSTNAMAELPRGLIADAKGSLDLICTHPFSGFAKQKCSGKPFNQWQVGVMENRASSNRELIVAFGAIEQLGAIHQPRNLLALAADTLRTIRPAQTLKQFPASVIGRKQIAYVN